MKKLPNFPSLGAAAAKPRGSEAINKKVAACARGLKVSRDVMNDLETFSGAVSLMSVAQATFLYVSCKPDLIFCGLKE